MRAPRTARALRADDGFTLGEVLVTVLLVGLLTLAVAAGIGVAVKACGSIKQATEANALMGNAVTAVQDELRFAYDVEAVSARARASALSTLSTARCADTASTWRTTRTP